MPSVRRFAFLFLIALGLTAPAAAAGVPITARVGFEKNQGQFPSNVLYALRPGAYLTANALVLAPDKISITFPGGNPAPAVSPSDTLPYLVNVYAGSDPSKWVSGIQRFGQVEYAQVYPGVDLSFTADPFLTFRFVIAPGADSSAIQMNVPGCCGNPIVIFLQQGRIGLGSSAYQDTAAGRVKVDLSLTGNAGSTVYGFMIGAHDATLPVIIENTLPVNGSGFGNFGTPRTAAASGSLYGWGNEPDFVTTGPPPKNPATPVDGVCGISALNTPIACRDATIYKYSLAGDLVYVTYLSGATDDVASAIAVDGADTVYVAGTTNSSDFPVTSGAFQKIYAGPPATLLSGYPNFPASDVFVVKLDSAGRVIYSTYLGGPNPDSATNVHLDSSGDVFVSGPASAGLPVTAGALQSTPTDCNSVTFPCPLGYIAKMDMAGHLAFLTYLPNVPATLTVDGQGNIFFAGSTAQQFTPGAQAFIAKLDPSGSSLLYNTTYSALGATGIVSIAIDSQGSAWISGPDSGDVISTWIDEYFHPYLAKLSADGSKVLYQTPFIGGDLAIGANDNLSILTQDYGTSVVRTPGGMLTSACSPVTVSMLDSNGKVLLNRPLNADGANFNADGGLLTYTYQQQGFNVIPVAPGPSPDSSCMLNAASLSIPNKVAPGEIVTIFGHALGPAAGAVFKLDPQNRVPTSAGGAQILFDGVPAPILYADDGQVNAIAPYSLIVGNTAAIQVQYQGRMTPPISATVAATAPAFFSLDGSGAGRALVFNQDGTLNSPSSPAKLGSIVTLFATGIGATRPPSIEGTVATSLDARPVTAPAVILAGLIATQVLYAGPSPGSSSSVTQLNVRLPASVPANSFPLSQWPILIYTPGQTYELVTIALSP
jgi:uncharacterized protein (TIGR03437 family)